MIPTSFRLAVAAYPVEALADWRALELKLDRWLGEVAAKNVSLAVMPEYAGMEAAMLAGASARDETAWCERAADAAERYVALCSELARTHRLYLLSGSLPVRTLHGFVNRAHFHAPDGGLAWQDKQVLTPWERTEMPLVPGDPVAVFDTDLGRIGVLICYDSEFPSLAAALDVDLLLVPSYTEAISGRTRVRLAARARALEAQCVTAVSSLLGAVPECVIVDATSGQAGIFGPPDTGFPDDGILADGNIDSPSWVIAELAPADIARTRNEGGVALLRDRAEAEACARRVEVRRLSHNRP